MIVHVITFVLLGITNSFQAFAKTESHTFLPTDEPLEFGKLGDECEFKWNTEELYGLSIGPFLTTCEFLSTQFVVLHAIPRRTSRGTFTESVGSCTIRLNEAAFGRVVHFHEELHHLGSVIGIIRGRFRVLWDDAGWNYASNPKLHPLHSTNLHKIPVPPIRETEATGYEKFPDDPKSRQIEPILYRSIRGEIFGDSGLSAADLEEEEEVEVAANTKKPQERYLKFGIV